MATKKDADDALVDASDKKQAENLETIGLTGVGAPVPEDMPEEDARQVRPA